MELGERAQVGGSGFTQHQIADAHRRRLNLTPSNHSTSSGTPLSRATSRGVFLSYPIQLTSACCSRRYFATPNCPPRHACQSAFVIWSRDGGGCTETCVRTVSRSPNAAACQT